MKVFHPHPKGWGFHTLDYINNIKDFNINDKLKVELLSQYNQHIRYYQEHYYKNLIEKYDINAIDTIILEEAQEI